MNFPGSEENVLMMIFNTELATFSFIIYKNILNATITWNFADVQDKGEQKPIFISWCRSSSDFLFFPWHSRDIYLSALSRKPSALFTEAISSYHFWVWVAACRFTQQPISAISKYLRGAFFIKVRIQLMHFLSGTFKDT